MQKGKWTKERIIRQLQQWQAEGVPAREMNRKDPPMTSMAAYLFGRWRTAMEEAGIEPVRKKWHRDRILAELQRTRGRGLPIPDVLVAAARREFGTLRNACEVAGVHCLTQTPPHQSWTKKTAIAAIQKRHRDGRPLRSTCRDDPALYAAGKRLFGGWLKALEASGFGQTRTPLMSAGEVLDRIGSHHHAGKSLSDLRRSNPLLECSARRKFGSWLKACDAAGVRVKHLRRWSKQAIIDAIRERHADGYDLRRTWREDTALMGSARYYFGNWQDALKAAGFEPTVKERWNKQRVIDRLRAWHERSDQTNLKESDEPLSAACYRLFGSHVAAMEAAGIEPRWQDAQGKKRWTKDRVVSEIQDRFIAGYPPDQLGFGDKRLAAAAKRMFGSWLAAVESAGLTDRVNFKPIVRRWNRNLVIAEIQAWHSSGHKLTEINRKNRSLFDAAKRHFGTWNQAIVAAGLKPERRRYTDEEILERIRKRHRAGESLSCKHPDNISLGVLASNRFGTWRKALSAAGVVQFGRRKVAS